jgi:hypothetical protein
LGKSLTLGDIILLLDGNLASGKLAFLFMSDSNPFEIASFMKPFDYAGQRKESQAYLSDYANAIRGQEALPAMYERLSGQYNIPQQKELVQGLGQQMTGLNQRLYELPGVVSGTTRNSLVTQGQRANLIESKSAPMRADLAALGSVYGPAASALASSQQDVSTQMGLGQAQQAKELLPFEQGFTIMETQQAREFSGYSLTNQMELDRLIANANNGLAWTNAEKDRAMQLAEQEQNYKLELQKLGGGGNNYLSVGEGSAIYDPATGKVLYKNPKTYQTGGGSGW